MTAKKKVSTAKEPKITYQKLTSKERDKIEWNGFRKGHKFVNYIIAGNVTPIGMVFVNCKIRVHVGSSLFRDCRFVNCDFLKNDCIDFANCKFVNCRFGKSKLSYVDFYTCTFEKCDFGTLHYYATNFHKCQAQNCTIKGIRGMDGYGPSGRISEGSLYDLFDSVVPMTCPRTGSYTAYKKCVLKNGQAVIVVLNIPETADRSSAFGNKCRASEALVVDIFNMKTGRRCKTAQSVRHNSFIYTRGEVVKPTTAYDTNRFKECSYGIHHFMSRKEAEEYSY